MKRGITPEQAAQEGWFTPNPTGLCFCGCGQQTTVARVTDRMAGRVKGQAALYLSGHNPRSHDAMTYHQALLDGWFVPNPYNGLCECGCGQTTPLATSTNRHRGYLKGHRIRFCHGHNQRGQYHYESGHINSQGYRVVRAPGHPNALRNGAILEHRLRMAEYLGRALLPHETVHHCNGVRHDNRIDNLELRVGPHGVGATHCWNCGVSLTPAADDSVRDGVYAAQYENQKIISLEDERARWSRAEGLH